MGLYAEDGVKDHRRQYRDEHDGKDRPTQIEQTYGEQQEGSGKHEGSEPHDGGEWIVFRHREDDSQHRADDGARDDAGKRVEAAKRGRSTPWQGEQAYGQPYRNVYGQLRADHAQIRVCGRSAMQVPYRHNAVGELGQTRERDDACGQCGESGITPHA